MTIKHAWFVVGCALLLSPQVLFANDIARPSGQPVAQLIRDLDDDNYFVRERALHSLASSGMQVIPALGDALLAGSPEVAWRASLAMEQIAIEGDEAQLHQVADLLKKLSKQKPHLAQIAGDLARRQQWARHQQAVANLRSLGARVVGGNGDEAVDELAFADVGGMVELEAAIPEEVEEAPAPAGKGLFGAIRALARVFLPGMADPDAPPLPEAMELDAPEVEAPAEAESPDIEVIGRAVPRLAEPDIEVVEAAEPELMEAAIELDLADFGVALGEELEGDASLGVSQIVLDKGWLGGDEGLAHLKEIKGLNTIIVENARLTDAALAHLQAIPHLQQLTLRGTPFTKAALRKWREKKPDLQIWAFGDAMMGVGADMGAGPLVLNHVYARSGAAEAGLAEGDVIRQIDGEEIRDFADLMLSVYQHQVGDRLKVAYEREGKVKTVEVPLKARQALERAMVDPFR